MVIGTVAVVFFADSFIGPFQGFLITLGVPIAAWCGVMLADIALRKRDYAEPELFDPRGRYGSVQPVPLALLVVGTFLGWGLVTNTFASWLGWQGYLLEPFGLGGKDGAWAYANLGVLARLPGRPPRHPGPAPRRPSAPRRHCSRVTPEGWLVVVDLQHVFGDADSPWAAPRFDEIRPADPRISSAAFGDRVVWTRFVAPAEPAGAWKEYYEQFPFALQPPDAQLYQLVDDPGAHPVVDATTFGKWGPDLAAVVGEGPLTVVGVATDCCVISTVLPAADAGVPVRVVSDACAGSGDDDHERALRVMSLYAPLVDADDDGRGPRRPMIPAASAAFGCRTASSSGWIPGSGGGRTAPCSAAPRCGCCGWLRPGAGPADRRPARRPGRRPRPSSRDGCWTPGSPRPTCPTVAAGRRHRGDPGQGPTRPRSPAC